MNEDGIDHAAIKRMLWHEIGDKRVTVPQTDLRDRPESLVILGEAGMGKSHLLEWLSTLPGYSLCTARQLINRRNPLTLLDNAEVLVIDALDEVSAHKDGDAIDLVLRKLGELNYPRFVMSCRVADWRSATGCETIREQYASHPIEFHLEPFTDDDVIALLGTNLGAEKAASVIRHFSLRGLGGLLRNPQTLQMIANVAGSGSLPETRAELFERAIELLRVEHKVSKAEKKPAKATGLDASGAAFAALILTGSEVITRAATVDDNDGELPIAEIVRLPGGTAIDAMLDTRLFRANGSDRFSYWHRRVGEYLGAQWLAKRANSPRRRGRLLSLFHSHGLVPANLRGIHAWLARDPALAQAVIERDPLGVIEYGDAGVLTALQAHQLLIALRRLAERDPFFYDWGTPSAHGIFQPELIGDIRQIISLSRSPFALRLFLVKAIKGTPTISSFKEDLRNLILDPKTVFAIRSAAAETLASLQTDDDEWRSIIRALRAFGDDQSIRLALEVLDTVGYAYADDAMIIGLIVLGSAVDVRISGVLYALERDLPDDRIDGILDGLATAVSGLGGPHGRPGDKALTDFAYTRVTRRLVTGNVSANKLWTWLEPFIASNGYGIERQRQLEEFLRADDSLRRAMQRLVILEQPGNQRVWQRVQRLCDRSVGLQPSAEDIVMLLQSLDPEDHADERWRELVELTQHDGEVGAEVRAAARPFTAGRSALHEWIETLANRPVPEWKIELAEREQHARAQQKRENDEQRKNYAAHIDRIRSGDYGWIIGPAKAYLRLFYDLGSDVPAHERVAQWLGEDIASAAHEGFEYFLAIDPPKPSATDISEALSEGKSWDAEYIVVAAFAERVRRGASLADLPDERLQAGLFVLRNNRFDNRAGIEGIERTVEKEIVRRGKLKDAMKLYYEPQLRAQCKHVHGLYSLMQDDAHADFAADLALEWLEKFVELPANVEGQLLGRVIRSRRSEDLRQIVTQRECLNDVQRRHTWDAAGLTVDFDQTAGQLAQATINPQLLWHLRAWSSAFSDPAQIEWIVSNFRQLWPMAKHPSGGWSGDSNPWDASEYLVHLLRRLGGNHGDQAMMALEHLQNASPDGYTDMIRSITWEQARLRVETRYVPPSISAIEAIASDLPPITAADLQALMIQELSIVQAKVKSDDAESWRGFFDDHRVPYAEERCRDHLLGLLRQGSGGIQLEPETHVAGDKEVDISCSTGTLRIPIEVKGQWNRDLWRGADTQLDRLYASDWRAERRGIYLVLWFGDQSKRSKQLTSPGRGKKRPCTPNGLLDALAAGSKAAQEGRTAIFLLDLAR